MNLGERPLDYQAAVAAGLLRDPVISQLVSSNGAAVTTQVVTDDESFSHNAVVVNLADVEPELVQWHWPGYLPKGKLVVLDGDPSIGKSTLMTDIGSRGSTGAPWPDGAVNDGPVDVVLLTAEDGLSDTVRPRVDAAYGDPSRFHILDAVEYTDENGVLRQRPPVIPNDIGVLERLIRKHSAGIAIVDVLTAYLSSRVNSMVDQDVRGALMPLAKMAEAT